jgi:hypothetical protein
MTKSSSQLRTSYSRPRGQTQARGERGPAGETAPARRSPADLRDRLRGLRRRISNSTRRMASAALPPAEKCAYSSVAIGVVGGASISSNLPPGAIDLCSDKFKFPFGFNPGTNREIVGMVPDLTSYAAIS